MQLGEAEEAAEAAQRVVADAWRLHSSHVTGDVIQLFDLMDEANVSSIFAQQAHDLIAARSEFGATGDFTG
ncbi:MAG: hypothetical protein ACRDUV_12405 [Pseudonocardiaceae bacterium]